MPPHPRSQFTIVDWLQPELRDTIGHERSRAEEHLMTARTAHVVNVNGAIPYDIAERRARDEQRVENARLILRSRREMAKHFPMDVFRDQAWDVLLDLFISDVEGRDTCVKQALLSADLSSTSAMRLIERLEGASLVTRTPDDTDHRRMIVRLTELGRSAIVLMLDELFPEAASERQK